jgi:hypothetical protein
MRDSHFVCILILKNNTGLPGLQPGNDNRVNSSAQNVITRFIRVIQDFFNDGTIPRSRGGDDSTGRMPRFVNCFDLCVFAAA